MNPIHREMHQQAAEAKSKLLNDVFPKLKKKLKEIYDQEKAQPKCRDLERALHSLLTSINAVQRCGGLFDPQKFAVDIGNTAKQIKDMNFFEFDEETAILLEQIPILANFYGTRMRDASRPT